MSFNITEDDYKKVISRIVELESTVKQIVGISTPYHLGLRVDEIVLQNVEIVDKCDKLRSKMSEYIEKENDDPEKAPTILEAYEKSGVSLTDIAQVFKINTSYVQKIIDGSSDNKSLKKRILNYLVNLSLSE